MSANRFVTPYGIRFLEDGRLEVFPAAEVWVGGRGRKRLHTLFHIDSGATTSIMPASDAEFLGLATEGGKRFIVRGITGTPLTGFRHTIVVRLGTFALKLPLIFVNDPEAPRILGREGLFPRFGIFFDEARRRVAFLDERSERKRINAVFD